jgi:hypothetical protein
MEWVLFVSLQWIVLGSPTQPTSQQIQSFTSEELCNKAAEAITSQKLSSTVVRPGHGHVRLSTSISSWDMAMTSRSNLPPRVPRL